MYAFTLARRDHREHDQSVFFYTKESGKIEVIARGVKRSVAKNSAALEPFSLLDIEVVKGRTAAYVTKVTVLEPFAKLRIDPVKMVMASLALSAVEKVTKNDEPDQKIFKLLFSYFTELENSDAKQFHQSAFLGRLVCFLGFTPVVATCVTCGKKIAYPAYFSAKDGGTICVKCAAGEKFPLISKKISKALRGILIDEWKMIGDYDLNVADSELVKKLIRNFSEYHLGVSFFDPTGMFGKNFEKVAKISQKAYNSKL